jgi:hypothetical protein
LKSESNAAVLLAHEGELDDVRDLLSGLGLAFVECRRNAEPDELDRPWSLVVATPQWLLKHDRQPESGSRRVQIAIGSESRTLRKTMSRLNIDFFVRRPVHVEALRLLIMHALYQGPEKRRKRRVSVGAPVRFRTALRRRSGILVDLSETGCRLMSEHAADPGLSIKLAIPAGRHSPTRLSVQGTIIRTDPAVSGPPGSRMMRVIFDDLSRSQMSRLQRIVEEFADGPASFAGELDAEGRSDEDSFVDYRPTREDRSQAPRSTDLEREPVDWSNTPMTADSAPNAAAPVPAPRAETAPGPTGGSAASARNRRAEPRRIFSRQVVALANEKSRVLLARDLSVGGMRTDRDPDLAVGDDLTVALPLAHGQVPLVIKARVIRDDGESGLVLQFRDVSEEAAAFLREKSSFLPICDTPFEEEEPAWVIVSEILERRTN